MKRFFYACVGILALAMSFHLGASTVKASGSLGTVAAMTVLKTDSGNPDAWVLTDDGDLYTSGIASNPENYQFRGNIFNGMNQDRRRHMGRGEGDVSLGIRRLIVQAAQA